MKYSLTSLSIAGADIQEMEENQGIACICSGWWYPPHSLQCMGKKSMRVLLSPHEHGRKRWWTGPLGSVRAGMEVRNRNEDTLECQAKNCFQEVT